MRKLFIAILAVCVFFMPGKAQQKKITGKIPGGDAPPSPNASIAIRDPSSGTMTDEEKTFP